MDIGLVNSVGSTNEVSGVKNTGYNQEVKKPDYSKYSISDLRKIPFEEAKANFDAIEQRSIELSNKGLSKSEEIEIAGFHAQQMALKSSDNNSFNKGFYESLQNIEHGGSTLMMYMETMQNLKDYYYGKDVKASFEVSNDPIHTDKDITKAQINSIDFNDFISKMVSGFKQELNSASKAQDEVKKQYQNIVDSYDILQKSYDKAMRTPYYA